MIKVIIIDDEPLARSLVSEYLSTFPEIEIIKECGDGFDGLKSIQTLQPDLVFLDIQMPKITGFEMLELIENPPHIIFTTAFDAYAMQAFEANAIDYLLKPFSKERFDRAMQKWLTMVKNNQPAETNYSELQLPFRPEEKKRLVVKTNQGIKILPFSEVQYLEAYDDYVKIYTKDGMHLKKKTLSYFEQLLNDGDFIRVHRSFVIAISQITRIEQPEKDYHIVLLKNGQKIPVSRQGYSKLKEAIGL
jgi:two-component system LytT family response regulator